MHQRCVIIANPESGIDSFRFQIAPIRGLNPGWIWIRFWTKIDQILIKILVGLGARSRIQIDQILGKYSIQEMLHLGAAPGAKNLIKNNGFSTISA